MEHLFKAWNSVKARLERDSVYVFTDFDGTLAPIRRHPDDAGLSGRMSRILRRLADGKKKLSVAVVSGRSLADIRRRIKTKNVLCAGNHGLEMEINGKISTVPGAAASRRTIQKIRAALKKECRNIRGVIIEDKGLTISVHFRMARPAAVKTAKVIFDKLTRPYLKKKKVIVAAGKKVWEVKPPVKWNKGKAVMYLLEKSKALPVYMGDDTTDEDAFRAVRRKGITVFVGAPRRTMAEYYLKNTREAAEFLNRIIKMRSRREK